MKKRVLTVIMAAVIMTAAIFTLCACDPYPRKAELVADGRAYGGTLKDKVIGQRIEKVWHFKYEGQTKYFDVSLMFKGEKIDYNTKHVIFNCYRIVGGSNYSNSVPTEPGNYEFLYITASILEGNKVKYQSAELRIMLVIE